MSSKEEKEFIKNYDMREYEPISLTVDLVLFTVKDQELQVLLVERKNHPFKGCWALPGGFVETTETLDEAAARELKEETSITVKGSEIEQLKTYASPTRDPRGFVASVAYVGFLPDLAKPIAGDDALRAELVPVKEVLENENLAFDHAEILEDALNKTGLKYT